MNSDHPTRSTARDELLSEIRRLTDSSIPITEETEVSYDLGVEGDDLEQLLVWVQERFDVDFSAIQSGDLNLNEPPTLIRGWFGQRRFKSMTVGSLLDAIETRRWVAQ